MHECSTNDAGIECRKIFDECLNLVDRYVVCSKDYDVHRSVMHREWFKISNSIFDSMLERRSNPNDNDRSLCYQRNMSDHLRITCYMLDGWTIVHPYAPKMQFLFTNLSNAHCSYDALQWICKQICLDPRV